MSSDIVQNEYVGNPKPQKQGCTYCKLHDMECIPPGGFTKRLISGALRKDNCLRKHINLALLFLSFPLCGICITDVTFFLMGPGYDIPLLHVLICLLLLTAIIGLYIKLLRHSKGTSVVPGSLLSKIRR